MKICVSNVRPELACLIVSVLDMDTLPKIECFVLHRMMTSPLCPSLLLLSSVNCELAAASKDHEFPATNPTTELILIYSKTEIR